MVIPDASRSRHVAFLKQSVGSQHRCAMAYAAAKLSNYKTVHRRFQGWCRDEILRRLLTGIANELRNRGALDEEECFIDATFVMAKGGGAGIGQRNAEKA